MRKGLNIRYLVRLVLAVLFFFNFFGKALYREETQLRNLGRGR